MVKIYMAFTDGGSYELRCDTKVYASRIVDEATGQVQEESGFDPVTGPESMGGAFSLFCVVGILTHLQKFKNGTPFKFHICELKNPQYSTYIPDGMTRNIGRWMMNGGKTAAGKPVPNWTEWQKIAAFQNSRTPRIEWAVMDRNMDEHAMYVCNLAEMIA